MRSRNLVMGVLLVGAACVATARLAATAAEDFQDKFDVPADRFASTGRNPYFNLEPGQQWTLTGEEDGKKVILIVSVFAETKKIDGVETRVVEERETHDGKLEEVSRNYFAVDKSNNDIYYFGEDVDMYKDGKVTSHEGSWLSGKDGAHFGMFMPAKPKVGQKFYQELAPKVAMDRVEVKSITAKVQVPAGTFENCVTTEETTPLEPGAKESKAYAPNVGLLIDGSLKLVKQGKEAAR